MGKTLKMLDFKISLESVLRTLIENEGRAHVGKEKRRMVLYKDAAGYASQGGGERCIRQNRNCV
jgi:hypothetical protein